MKISKMSDQNKLKLSQVFSDSTGSFYQKKQAKKKQVNIQILMQEQKSKKTSRPDYTTGSKNIMPATGSVVKDVGGPNKHIGFDCNSIWDSQKIARKAQTQSSSEKTRLQKQALSSVRNSYRQQRIDMLADALQGTDTRKQSSVKNLSSGTLHNSQTTRNAISMFGNEQFSNLPQKTAGQIMSESKNKQTKKDFIKQVGTSKISNNLLDNLFTKRDQE